MGRKKLWHEMIVIRMSQELLDRIAASTEKGEDRSAFIRAAIERELRRRERR